MGKTEIKPFVVWIYGVPGIGKSFFCKFLQKRIETELNGKKFIMVNNL